MEQKNGQTEQGTAMPDQSNLERKRQMHNALCVNDTAAIFQYHRWYQNLRAAGGLQWSGRHGGNAYE